LHQRLIGFFKNAGVILAVILAIIQLWNWLTALKGTLYADVEFAAFVLPPSLAKEVERIDEQIDSDQLKKLADLSSVVRHDDPERVKESLDLAISNLSLELRQRTPRQVPYELSSLRGIYWRQVTNNGSAALSEVRLSVLNAELVQISREGQIQPYRRRAMSLS